MSLRIRIYLFIVVMLTQRVYSVRFLSRVFCSQPTPLLKGLSVDVGLSFQALRKEFPNLLSKVTPADVQRIQSTRLSGSYKLSPFVGKVMNEGVEDKTRPWSHIIL